MRRISITLLLITLAACQDQSAIRITGPQGLRATISDATNGGNPHFYFLAPILTAAAHGGTFDANVAPTVSICEWNGSACVGDPIATFTTTSGAGSEVVRVDSAEEQYVVNWHTKRFNLHDGSTYRIRVLVGAHLLGHADVRLYRSRKDVKNVDTGGDVALSQGGTLPIKFRIEEGAVPVRWGQYGVAVHRLPDGFAVDGMKSRLNDRGQVPGHAAVGSARHAAVFTIGGGVNVLGTLGGQTSVAYDVNSGGQVTGTSYTGAGTTRHAFLFTGGAMQDLGTLGGASFAYGLNQAGQVIGASYNSRGIQRAFLQAGGTWRDLGVLGDPLSSLTSTAADINAAGQVVGTSGTAGSRLHAFLYSGGTMQDLGTLGGSSSNASGINDAGLVVGSSATSSTSVYHAFLYSGGTMQDLGTAGGTESWAHGISGAAQVVGQALVGRIQIAPSIYRKVYRAVLWQDAGSGYEALAFDDLVNDGATNAGWSFTNATSISDGGRFVLAEGLNAALGYEGWVVLEAIQPGAPQP
jgi:probable HAF family extracellular repeat protein